MRRFEDIPSVEETYKIGKNYEKLFAWMRERQLGKKKNKLKGKVDLRCLR